MAMMPPKRPIMNYNDFVYAFYRDLEKCSKKYSETTNEQKECHGCGAPKNNYKCEYCGRIK
jgi:hypothetical protein